MPPLGFVTEYSRVLNGLSDGLDPLEGMGGILDNWWNENLTDADQRRERSWDKQVNSILGPERGAVAQRQGEPDATEPEFEVGAVFSLQAWETSQSNGRIPVAEMARVAGTNFVMEPHAAAALRSMMNAAAQQGIHLEIGNTYRDYEQQAGLYQQHISGNHPAPVAKPGSSNHGWGLAVDLSAVTNAEFQWLLNNAHRFGFSNPWVEGKGDRSSVEPWHWEYGQGGTVATTEGGTRTEAARVNRQHRAMPEPYEGLLAIDDLLTDRQGPAFGAVLASMYQRPRPTGLTPATAGSPRRAGGSVKTQLYRGFMDAGREDLAKMVRTKDFQDWINAESGWRVDAVSQSFPGHGRNYGLFQFWEGHSWTNGYLSSPTNWQADAYTQAKLVARYFPHLTPDAIRTYASQVRNGTYHGWG